MLTPTSRDDMTAWEIAAHVATRPAVTLAIPLVLVNTVAVLGQYGWALDNLGGSRAEAVLFAAALESVSLTLAIQAHRSLLAGDASWKLRAASIAAALLVGGLNYSHRAGPDLAPTAAAIAFGVLSAISPWLWSVHSTSMHREQLRGLGLVEPRTVRFSTLRWLLFPIRTYLALRGAVWAGETDPARAVALHELEMSVRVVKVSRIRRASKSRRGELERAPITPSPVAPAPPQVEAPPASSTPPRREQEPSSPRPSSGRPTPGERLALLEADLAATPPLPCTVRALAGRHGGSVSSWGETLKARREQVDA